MVDGDRNAGNAVERVLRKHLVRMAVYPDDIVRLEPGLRRYITKLGGVIFLNTGASHLGCSNQIAFTGLLSLPHAHAVIESHLHPLQSLLARQATHTALQPPQAPAIRRFL